MATRGTNKYAQVALLAADAAAGGADPQDAWADAAKVVFPDSPSSRAKGCPKSTFLALAGEGVVTGVLPGTYTRSEDNKRYALAAPHLLRQNQANAMSISGLWIKVLNATGAFTDSTGGSKQHNSQMDIVIALWQARKIV